MANETLHIENFAGIKNADIELGVMNVFIGPQASGKSVCAKLFYFFKQCFATLAVDVVAKRTKSSISTGHKEIFIKYFPRDSWLNESFVILYSSGDMWIEVSRRSASSNTLSIKYSVKFDNELTHLRKIVKGILFVDDLGSFLNVSNNKKNALIKYQYGNSPSTSNDNYFVPAGRSFFSTLRSSVFQFIANDLEIDPFLVEFGRFYERVRRRLLFEDTNVRKTARYMSKILCGKYLRDETKNKDYIIMDDSRRVAIENCSSGQQETLPLVLGLLSLSRDDKKAKVNTVFIEEPEAHLYPTAQREIVHFIAATIDFVSEDSTSQCVITTHSPYILTALNNLMYAGRIVEKSPDKRKQVTKVIEETAIIPPSHVRAYFFENGTVRSIIDPETQLIEAVQLDNVSDELSQEFGHLMDIEYQEVAA